MDLDDLDIYDDLDTFQKEEEKKSAELISLESKYNDSLKTIEALQMENADLKKQIKRIGINFQNLLDTAKAEIRRKDKQIVQLRQEKDDICFRRKLPRQGNEDGAATSSSILAATSHIINSWSNNDAAALLPQNYNAEYNRRTENSAVHKHVDSAPILSKIHNTLDDRDNAQKQEEYSRTSRRDEVTGSQNEFDSNSEKERRRHTQRDRHELTRYRPRSRERERSGRDATRSTSRNNDFKSTSRAHRGQRDSRSERNYADGKESNLYCKKSDDCGPRHLSHDKISDRPRHSREDKAMYNDIDYSRGRRCEGKKSIEYVKSRAKLNKPHKNASDTLVKISDGKKLNKEHIKDFKNKEENAKDTEQVPISKILKNDICCKSSNDLEAANENSISFENLSSDEDCKDGKDKSKAENYLTKEKLLALETVADNNTNGMDPIDGMTTPKKTTLFDRLFGSTPSNAQTVNSSLLSNAIVMLTSTSSSVTTSPSNYTNKSDQTAPTSSQKLNIESFVPIKTCDRQLPKDSESVITLSDTSESDDVTKPGLGNTFTNDDFSAEQKAEVCFIADRGSKGQSSKDNFNAKEYKETSNSMKDSVDDINHVDNPTPIVLSDEEDFLEIENIATKNENGRAPKVDTNHLTLQGKAKCEINVVGERKTLVHVRLPNIYEIRAQQRQLRAEAAKNAENMKEAPPGLVQKTTITSFKENVSATKKSSQHSKILPKICKDAKIQNSEQGPLDVGVEMDTRSSVIEEKRAIGVSKFNKAENVVGADSTKLNIYSPDAVFSPVKFANSNKTKADLLKLKPVTEGITENAVNSIQARSGVIELMHDGYSRQNKADIFETAIKIQPNAIEADSECHRTGKKSVVSYKTDTIPVVDESLINPSSELLASNEKSENLINCLPETCVIEEKVPGKSHAFTTAECHPLVTEVKEISAVIKIVESEYVSQSEMTLSLRSNTIEEINAIAPDESAVEMNDISDSLIGEDEDMTTGAVKNMFNEQKKNVDGQNVVGEQMIVDSHKIFDSPQTAVDLKICDQQKIAGDQKLEDGQKQTSEKELVDVQNAADERKQVEPAKHIPAESPNEYSNVIEDGTDTNINEIIDSRESQSNKNDTEIEDRTVAILESKENSSNAINYDTLFSAIGNSDSNRQSFVENAVVSGENSKIVENREKTLSEKAESESIKEIEDAVAYLMKSMGTHEESCLDETEMEVQLKYETPSEKDVSKVVDVPLNQNKCTTDERTGAQNSKTKWTPSSKSTKPEHSALIDNMKRAEIMWKFKIPKISAKRKRANNDEGNDLKESAEYKKENKADGLKITAKVEDDINRNLKKSKKEENAAKLDLAEDLTEATNIVKINANIERELLDKQLLSGRTPEEEQALSAEQAKSERIIKEIDNWARRKVGNASEITESALIIESTPTEKIPHPIEKLELISKHDESNVNTPSIVLEEEQKTGAKAISYGNDKMSILKDQLPTLAPQQKQDKGPQLANNAVVQLADLKTATGYLQNKHCKYEKAADSKSYDTHTKQNQKTDCQKLSDDSKSENKTHQLCIIKFPIINKKKPTPIKERIDFRSQASALPVLSEEMDAKDSASPNIKGPNAKLTASTQVLKPVKSNESVCKIDNKTSQSLQLDSKTKITGAKGKVCATSQAEVTQDTSESDSSGKLMGNHKPEIEKPEKDVVGKKRATEKHATGLTKETVQIGRNKKRAKLEVSTMKVETVHKTSITSKGQQVPSTKQQKTALAAAGSSKVVLPCNHVGTSNSKKVASIADTATEHKPVKRCRTDASSSDECEVMPKSRNRKRCKMRIADSEEEDVCTTAQQPTQNSDEVSETDLLQNIDILNILQNDRAIESNDVLPAPQTPTSLPANISQDEQYKELDSRLELMFASPNVAKTAASTQIHAVPKLAADVVKSLAVTLSQTAEQSLPETPVSPLPLTGTGAISINTRHAVDFNVSDTFLSDISSNSLQVSAMNVTIDETNHCEMNMYSSLSDSSSSTKHISLGSSDYRFEKVSDNVVNLFITRKRRGKRKQTAATTTAKDTISTT